MEALFGFGEYLELAPKVMRHPKDGEASLGCVDNSYTVFPLVR